MSSRAVGYSNSEQGRFSLFYRDLMGHESSVGLVIET